MYQSSTNLLNNVKPYTPSSQSVKKVEAEMPKKSTSKKYIYAGVGIVTLLGLLALRVGKLLKSIQNAFKKAEKQYQAVSLPDNTPIDIEVVDTSLLHPKSKLRMKPEIVDAEIEEIVPNSNLPIKYNG